MWTAAELFSKNFSAIQIIFDGENDLERNVKFAEETTT